MYNYGGIEYRLWAQCIPILLLGIIGFLLTFIGRKSELKRDFLIAGSLLILAALYFCNKYFSVLQNPDVQIFEGSYYEGRLDSRAAPPLPFTWSYRFIDAEGTNGNYYIDIFTKKEIFNEDFIKDDWYRIYYEADTQIIVKIEPIEK